MRIPFIATLLFALPLSAATLQVHVDRNGFAGPVEVAVAPREEGRLPEWPSPKTLAADASSVTFSDLAPGLYTVIARGPQPLQRLTANANLGATGAAVRLAIPKTNTALRVTLAGEPLPRATVTLTHDELRWSSEVSTNDDGRFTGALWEPGAYTAAVRRDRATAPHVVDVNLGTEPLLIDVPDRHISGRITAEDGKPIAGALVALRTESTAGAINVRAQSAGDGRFE
ncbi:MAG TPA: carboxypeptidase-like regulatory domain-containing protein, partial [Thermoanaerobaculia bacterium]|nr:carboxypeptidase-like regulatory domain-containing protein [Thermoanaerobaculia bacterium]